MDAFSLLALAIALAMDAFAVALAAGTVICPLSFRPCFRLSFHFGLFQALMPILGWLGGYSLRGFVAAWSHWIAFFLLAGIGIHMVVEALKPAEEKKQTEQKTQINLQRSVFFQIQTGSCQYTGQKQK